MFKYIVVIATHLSSLFKFLLYHSFSIHYYDQYFDFLPLGDQTTESSSSSLLSIIQYKSKPAAGTTEESSATVECAVCLCKIEEGEEVRELRCSHLFHKLCLDRWTGFKHFTCPLCRSWLAPPTSLQVSDQFEVLLYKFCSFSSESDHGDRWWLR